MDARGVDALVYPTIRTVPNQIGEPQRGSNCQLSATSGLPAISFPAGWPSGLPVGVELLARPFADARLVGIAYAFEQADGQRRAPAVTPPLAGDAPPAPMTATVGVTGSGARPARADVRVELDPVLGTLSYDVLISGVATSDVFAVVLRRTDAEGHPSVVARLTGPGVTADRGSLRLDEEMRAQLAAGEVSLVLVTREDPFGAVGGPVRISSR
jgi:hypothetical protein